MTGGHCYHDFSSVLFSQYEAERVEIGSRHQTKKQRLLGVQQLTHVHCNTHTHTQSVQYVLTSNHMHAGSAVVTAARVCVCVHI